MKIDFNYVKAVTIPNLNGGNGSVISRMFVDNNGKIMVCSIPPRASIGAHRQNTSSEYNFILSGNGKAICDGKEEILNAGDCHYCPKGSTHSIENTGDTDLVMYSVVAEQ